MAVRDSREVGEAKTHRSAWIRHGGMDDLTDAFLHARTERRVMGQCSEDSGGVENRREAAKRTQWRNFIHSNSITVKCPPVIFEAQARHTQI